MANFDTEKTDSTTESGAISDSGSDSAGTFKPADSGLFSVGNRRSDSTKESFRFFNETRTRAKTALTQHNKQNFFAPPAAAAYSVEQSRYRLYRIVRSPEKTLEMLMGRAFQTNDKTVIFDAIIELLSKPENQDLLRKSSAIYKCSAIELAMDLNNAGMLDNKIEKLKGLGCTYRPHYEAKLPQKLRKNKELSLEIPSIDEPYVAKRMTR